MTFIQYLNYRSEYERIVSGFVLPEDKYQGTIDSMQWFLEKGHTANRFRKGFDDVTELCHHVLKKMGKFEVDKQLGLKLGEEEND